MTTPVSNPLKHLITGAVRVALRTIYAPLYILWLRIRVWVWGTWSFEHAVAHTPPWLTIAILKAYGAQIGAEFEFHGRLNLHGTYETRGKLVIGSQCHIGPGVTLDLSRPIVLEDRCTVALNAQILTHQDVGYSPLAAKAYPTRWGSVTVEYGAFIGAGAIVLPGVRIGRCAMVAAGALVREDVPPFTVVGGVPAQILKHFDPDEMALR